MLLAFGGVLMAQQTGNSAGDLRQRRQQLLRDLQRNQQRLDRTRREKQETMEQLSLLGAQIRKREQLIETLRDEVEQLEADIYLAEDSLDQLQRTLDGLRTEYSQTLRTAYRAMLTRSWAAFLFASSDFDEALKRWQYFRRYQRYRRRQAREIARAKELLLEKAGELAARKAEKENLLSANEQQRGLLTNERSSQNQLLGKLKVNEGRINAEITEQQKAHEALNAAIESAIAEEVARQRRRAAAAPAANAASGSTTSTATASRESNPESRSFAALRGRLPWPVSGGRITRKFGRHPHPTLPNIQVANNGIDISATAGAAVNCVHAGEVASLQFVSDFQHTVLVRHGDYYTVYSSLSSVSVSKGQKLNAGDRIGTALGGDKPVHFEVWRLEQRQDPELWISRR